MTPDLDLHGKRVLVVGGETALGRAVVIGLAEAGADVAIVSLTSETKAEFAINSALNELWALQRQGLALAIDAADAEQVRAAVERADRELGRPELVIAVGEGTAVAALGEREVVELAVDADADEALEAVLAGL